VKSGDMKKHIFSSLLNGCRRSAVTIPSSAYLLAYLI